MNTDEVVRAYLNIRDTKDSLEKQVDELKSEMKVLEAIMLEQCNQVGAESIKTPHGLVMKSLKERYWTSDWDTFYPMVRENPELLEKRISQGNFKEYLKDHLQGELPSCVNVQREYAITVRKAS